jgi:endonuclease-8
MAEGDTTHYAARRIRGVLDGRVPDEILAPQPRHLHEHWPTRLSGRVVHSVDAYGKHLFLRFEGGLTLYSHLRTSGSWRVCAAGAPWGRPRHTAWLLMRVADWEVVQVNGPSLGLARDLRVRHDRRLARLGQDVLGKRLSSELFLRRLRGGDQSRFLGEALLHQRNLAGIGNVWKAEACFGAGISPWRGVGELADQEALAIVDFARTHMGRCAREGTLARPRAVYGRAGKPCPRCQGVIRQLRRGETNRVTFWCPRCQR